MNNKKSINLNNRLFNTGVKDFRLIFFAFIVGLLAGLAGSVFRYILSYIDMLRNNIYADGGKSGFISWLLPIILAVVATGIALFLVKKIAPETSGSGVQEIEGALDEVRPLRWKRVLPVKFFASLFSLGSGFLLGREGPTIQLGANVGKMVKDIFHRPDDEMNPLVSAGAAAGLASAFNAPFSGIIFVVEEMHGHFRHTFFTMAAIMVASGTADLMVRILVGASPVIKMTVFSSPPLVCIWLFVILGGLFGFVGYIFNKFLIIALDFFKNLTKSGMILGAILAGAVIAIVGIFQPDMIGGGYDTIRMVLDHSFTLKFLIVLFTGRLILTVLSYGTGVPGGIFAPLLALGVVFGILFGSIMQNYFPGIIHDPGIFAVAGMAGIFASTVRAPITGLMLAVEMTSNFELLLPLIFTTVTASIVATLLGNQPIYTILLQRSLAHAKNDNT